VVEELLHQYQEQKKEMMEFLHILEFQSPQLVEVTDLEHQEV
jgi:hypothetical protein